MTNLNDVILSMKSNSVPVTDKSFVAVAGTTVTVIDDKGVEIQVPIIKHH